MPTAARCLRLFVAVLLAFLALPGAAAAQTTACPSNVGFTGLGAASVKLVTGSPGNRVYICGVIASAGAAAGTVSLIEGTGTNCATNPLAVVGTVAGSILLPIASPALALYSWNALAKTQVAGNDLCIINATAGPVSGAVLYGMNP